LNPSQEVALPEKITELLALFDEIPQTRRNIAFCDKVIAAQKTLEITDDFVPLLKERSLQDTEWERQLEAFIDSVQNLANREKDWTLKRKPAEMAPAIHGVFIPEVEVVYNARVTEYSGGGPSLHDDTPEPGGMMTVERVLTDTYYLYGAKLVEGEGNERRYLVEDPVKQLLTLEEVQQKENVTMEPWLPESVQWLKDGWLKMGCALCNEPLPEQNKELLSWYRKGKAIQQPWRVKKETLFDSFPDSLPANAKTIASINESIKEKYREIEGPLTEENVRDKAFHPHGVTPIIVGAKPEEVEAVQDQYHELTEQRRQHVFTAKYQMNRQHSVEAMDKKDEIDLG
jgi:hypothetical protein